MLKQPFYERFTLSPGAGVATFTLEIDRPITPDDADDLLEWFGLIERRIKRAAAASMEAGQKQQGQEGESRDP